MDSHTLDHTQSDLIFDASFKTFCYDIEVMLDHPSIYE